MRDIQPNHLSACCPISYQHLHPEPTADLALAERVVPAMRVGHVFEKRVVHNFEIRVGRSFEIRVDHRQSTDRHRSLPVHELAADPRSSPALGASNLGVGLHPPARGKVTPQRQPTPGWIASRF